MQVDGRAAVRGQLENQLDGLDWRIHYDAQEPENLIFHKDRVERGRLREPRLVLQSDFIQVVRVVVLLEEHFGDRVGFAGLLAVL